MIRTRLLSCVAMALVLTLSGCAPEPIVWSPDSSSFLFSTKGNEAAPERQAVTAIRHFDVRSKSLRIVVSSKEWTATRLPAFSPDGKRIAVAQAWTWSKGQYIQVRTYRLDGSLDLASGEFRLLSPLLVTSFFQSSPTSGHASTGDTGWRERPTIVESTVEWSPDGRHLLVDTPLGCARYDFDTRRFRQFAPSVTVGLPGLVGHSILPDGTGFIAVWSGTKWAESTPPADLLSVLKSTVLVDWEGISRPFTVSPDAERAARSFAEAAKNDVDQGLSAWRQGRWDGRVVVCPLSTGSLVVDPEARTITYREDPSVLRYTTWAKQNRVEAFERFGENRAEIVSWNGRIDIRVDRGAWKTIGYVSKDRAEFFPSPDRRLVAVRFVTQSNVRRTLVLDSQGVVVGEFDME